MDSQTIALIVGLGVLLIGPGYWLYRDTRRHGANSWAWVVAYAIAVAPPTRLRFLFAGLVFGAWFLVRGRKFTFFKRVAKFFSGSRRKTPGPRR